MPDLYYSPSHLPDSDSISIDSQSSVSTNATAPNLVGAGRTLGLVIDRGGSWLERLANRWATRNGHGPHETAKTIREIQAENTLVAIPYVSQDDRRVETLPMKDNEKKIVKNKCRLLLKYTR